MLEDAALPSMKLSTTTALFALATTTAASGVARIPVARNPAGSVRRRTPRLSKRATITESLINNVTEGGYFATVSIGTPAQDVTLILDTGSSDAWVVSSSANLCEMEILQIEYDETCDSTCEFSCRFPYPPLLADVLPDDASSSSTYNNLGSDFEIQYVDGSSASGSYFTDDFTIGDKTVKDLQMGLADATVIGTGILGIGFVLNEAAETQYSNLVTSLVNQSLISTTAYSLYLNDYYSSTGSILFGGIDTEKFIGALDIVPILPDSETGNYSSFTVALTGLSFTSSNGTSYDQSLSGEGGSLDSVLDSGTTLTYLPDALATELFDAIGAYQYSDYSSSSAIALVDCKLDAEFSFRINGTTSITVPADELVIDAFAGYQDSLPSSVPFDETCLFGIQSLGDASDESGGDDDSGSGGSTSLFDYAILGDTFLRSAYVVYDLDNLQIGIAPANLNSTSTNIQELTAGATELPQVTGVASQTEPSSTGKSESNHCSFFPLFFFSPPPRDGTVNTIASMRAPPLRLGSKDSSSAGP